MTTPTQATVTPGDQRRTTVDNARQQWIRKLIDLSRRNNLLYFRPLKSGTLDLSQAPLEQMAALLSGKTVPVSKLFPEDRDEVPDIVREISRRALSNAEEKGLQTLFVALGIATWPAMDDGRPPESPVLLVPVAAATQGRGSNVFTLTRAGNVQVNLVLLHVLESQFGVKATADELIPLLLGDDEGEPFDPQPLYNELIARAGQVKGFGIRPGAILGNFAFQKMAMVKDLQQRGNELAAHDLIAAIAGDKDARLVAGARECNLDPKQLDKILPDNEFFVLDADSSQQCAVTNILSGQSAVVHGPPGTGKSQTIVNLMASLAANGKRVLFVAEKRAALEVVQRRLRDVGLDHLAIDLHGADVAPKRVMEQVSRALETVRFATPVDCKDTHVRVADRRDRLNKHVERMHRKCEPAGRGVYEIQGLLLKLSRTVAGKTRWRGAELQKLTPAVAERIRDLLKEAGGFATLVLRTDPSPWTGAPLKDGKQVQNALDLVARLKDVTLAAFLQSQAEVAKAAGFTGNLGIEELRKALALITEVQAALRLYSPELFDQNLACLARDLAPAANGGVAVAWAFVTNTQFRAARRKALGLRTAGKVSAHDLHEEIAAAAKEIDGWNHGGFGNRPSVIDGFDLHESHFSAFWADYDRVKQVLGRDLGKLTSDDFVCMINRLNADSNIPFLLPKVNAMESELAKSGVQNLVGELRASRPSAADWPAIFDLCWYASTLDAACEQDPEIRGFNGSTHNGFVSEFADLDAARIELAAARVRRAHAERAVTAMNAHPDQEMLIRAEAQKSRRHLPLRRVFAEASEVLTAVCPCWMASPLSVSQLLDSGRRYFDFVVFDEASQVLPEDAVCSVLRGDRLVVAGDRNQLPPTTFFSAATEDDMAADEEDASDGYESLLDMMNGFLPSNYLDWHYRSRDEALIAFSNHHIYNDRLVTFPGPGGPPAMSHVVVQQALGSDGQEESSAAEVQKVIELVLDHARKRPEETLGVITMGIKHRNRIQAALDKALRDRDDLNGFFDENKIEHYFIKNLEAVQGDERDAIIISIGYGKDRSGNLPFRFGPLLPEGGRRRLNVAVTRARKRVTLVSSFSHLDMDMGRVRPGTGVELLRNYLEYAASQGKRLGDTVLTTVAPNDFEQDVQDALSARGMRLIPQLGASRFRIDLVAEHPTRPGQYVLAIECDGATYHSSNTARDRDRLRQRQLENLGWRFHRIWSTDWFMHKEQEVERTLRAFEEAVKRAGNGSGASGNNGNGNGIEHQDNGRQQTHLNGRGPKPVRTGRSSISDYSRFELVQLVRWIKSDGLMRTDDELIRDMVEALEFFRRGVRIESAIRNAISMANPKG